MIITTENLTSVADHLVRKKFSKISSSDEYTLNVDGMFDYEFTLMYDEIILCEISGSNFRETLSKSYNNVVEELCKFTRSVHRSNITAYSRHSDDENFIREYFSDIAGINHTYTFELFLNGSGYTSCRVKNGEKDVVYVAALPLWELREKVSDAIGHKIHHAVNVMYNGKFYRIENTNAFTVSINNVKLESNSIVSLVSYIKGEEIAKPEPNDWVEFLKEQSLIPIYN